MESSTPPRDTAWAMSEENVEIFKRGIEAWNRKDIPGFLRAADPEIRWEHWLADLEGDLTGVSAASLARDIAPAP